MSVQGDYNMASDAKIPNSMIEKKPQQKVIRVLTVLAYVLSVSMAAILLSIYYIFMWDGRPHIGQSRSLLGIGTQNDSDSNLTTMLAPKMERLIDNSIEDESETTTTNNNTTSLADITSNYDIDKENISISENSTVRETLLRIKRNIFVSKMSAAIQQQLSAVQIDSLKAASTVPPTTIATTTDDTATLSDDYESLEDLRKSSILVEKMLNNDNYDEKYFFK